MNKAIFYFLIVAGLVSCQSNGEQKETIAKMIKVGDWMQENRKEAVGGGRADTDWTVGAWYAGQYALWEVTQEDRHLKPLLDMEIRAQWKLGRRTLFADDQCIAQCYIDLYDNVKKDPKMLAHTLLVFDGMISKLVDGPMHNHYKASKKGEWSWCDALFMGPPVWAKLYRSTGDIKYLDFMNKKWWKTYDFLYDKEEMLYYRDAKYFNKKEKNGAKVFWSRGNGCVMGGLVRVLECMPDDYADKPRYLKLYREMAAKIASLQQDDGFWRASLLDPKSFPGGETSGSAFFCYALAWGVNNGHLDEKTYRPVVDKSWQALSKSVHPSGKLGWVQPIGADPRMTKYEDTEVYGVGAFLLAGKEMLKLQD